MKILKSFFLVIGLVSLQAVFATQFYAAIEDETIKANISSKEISRVTLVGDRISQFFTTQGRFIIEKDETKGDLYLTPTPGNTDQPLNLFITSEQRKTFELQLTPTVMGSTTVAIKAPGGNQKIAKAWEQENPYVTSLTKLIQAMYKGETPKGYQFKATDEATLPNRDDVKQRLLSRYEGAHWVGEIFQVTNLQEHTITLSEADFIDANVFAVAIENDELAPKANTRVFMVKSYVENESQ